MNEDYCERSGRLNMRIVEIVQSKEEEEEEEEKEEEERKKCTFSSALAVSSLLDPTSGFFSFFMSPFEANDPNEDGEKAPLLSFLRLCNRRVDFAFSTIPLGICMPRVVAVVEGTAVAPVTLSPARK
jgi:hypothetical protein